MRIWMGALALFAAAGLAHAEGKSLAGPGNMMHCPSAVPGAKTEIKEIKDGVEVWITATEDAKVKEIRNRAKHVVEASKTDPNTVRHTGDGHGGGGLGRCAVVLKDTLVSAEDTKGGTRITVRPVKPVDLDWLRKETAARVKEAQAAK
jgi:hypothetical protein